MSNMKYIVMCRYECWTSHGKDWTKWFRYHSKYFETECDANDSIKQYKLDCKHCDSVTKLNREFKVDYIDLDLLPKPKPEVVKPKRPRGRPKKNAEV